MISIEVRRDGRMIGFVEPDGDSWAWILIETGTPQKREGFPSAEEALADFLETIGAA